jgi:membrane-bound ClpP family serine protease
MDPIVAAVFLLLVAILLVVIDVFIPTGGALLIAAGGFSIASMGFGFRHSAATGLCFVGLILACFPIGLFLFIKVWPNTSIGRKIIASQPERVESWSWISTPPGRSLNDMVGETGVVVSDLMPMGLIEIDGTRMEASCDGTLIESGTQVRIVRCNMGVLVVIPVVEGEVVRSDSPSTRDDDPAVSSTEKKTRSASEQESDAAKRKRSADLETIENVDLQNSAFESLGLTSLDDK